MDNSYFISALVILLLTVLISRILTERGNKYLSPEKKSALIDLFSKDRTYGLVAIIVVIVLFIIVMNFKIFSFAVSTTVYISLLLLLMIASGYRSWKILKTNGFPNEYIRLYLLSTGIKVMGMLIFFSLVFYPMIQNKF